MNTKEVMSDYLKKNGYDGLFNDEVPCGCLLKDIMPCMDIPHECKPGYRHEVSAEAMSECCGQGTAQWRVGPEKPVEDLEKILQDAKVGSWDKVIAFLQDNSDLTTEQIRADLEEQGVDVDAFLKRINDTVQKCKEHQAALKQYNNEK